MATLATIATILTHELMKTAFPSKPLIVGLLLTLAASAQAQALFLARKAIGRVEQMTQSAPAGNASGTTGASYDVATVIVEVAPDKVYAATARLLGQNAALRITRSDPARRSITFSKGAQIGGIQVNELGENLSQLLVSTAHSGTPEMNSAAIVAHILDVCRQLDVACQRPES